MAVDELTVGVQRRDPIAITQMYETYYSRLFKYASLLVGDRNTAEDIVHDVFVHVIGKPSVLNRSLGTILYTLINAKAKHYIRNKQNISFDLSDDGSHIDNETPDQILLVGELREIVTQALNDLPGENRTAIELWQEGFSYAKIGQELNISTYTFRYRKDVAFKLLRSHCESLR